MLCCCFAVAGAGAGAAVVVSVAGLGLARARAKPGRVARAEPYDGVTASFSEHQDVDTQDQARNVSGQRLEPGNIRSARIENIVKARAKRKTGRSQELLQPLNGREGDAKEWN